MGCGYTGCAWRALVTGSAQALWSLVVIQKESSRRFANGVCRVSHLTSRLDKRKQRLFLMKNRVAGALSPAICSAGRPCTAQGLPPRCYA